MKLDAVAEALYLNRGQFKIQHERRFIQDIPLRRLIVYISESISLAFVFNRHFDGLSARHYRSNQFLYPAALGAIFVILQTHHPRAR
jgi:hypothetical protein